ncbi:MAG: FMN-binding protein [Oscillospiraceae bacterium]
MRALVAVDGDGKIAGIAIVTLAETPGIGDRIKESAFLEKYVGLDASTVGDADTVTGATYSSKGLRKAAAQALETYNAHKEEILDAIG